MQAHYLITNPRQGTWGRGPTMPEALQNCQFTSSQDIVQVFLTDGTGHVTESGTVAGRFVTFLGEAKVMYGKRQVVMQLTGEPAAVHSIEERVVGQVHEILDGQEWDSDTPLAIANLLSDAGFAVREVEDVD